MTRADAVALAWTIAATWIAVWVLGTAWLWVVA